jgi:hypothetical protein
MWQFHKVIFIDGKFSSYLSSTTHDGLDCWRSALTKPKYKVILTNISTNGSIYEAWPTIPCFPKKACHSKSVVEKPPEITIFTGSLNDATAIWLIVKKRHAPDVNRWTQSGSNDLVTEIFLSKTRYQIIKVPKHTRIDNTKNIKPSTSRFAPLYQKQPNSPPWHIDPFLKNHTYCSCSRRRP